MALVKYNNNSISAITTAGQLASGSMVLIKEQTASSSASISFVDGSGGVVLDSTYPIYKFEFINIHPATDGQVFSFQGSTDTGSSYGVTTTSSVFNSNHYENDSSTALDYNTAADLAQSTGEISLTRQVGNDNDQSASGELYLFNPSSSTFVKHFISTTQTYRNADISQQQFTGGYLNTTSSIDAIRFKFASGNIDSGTIKLYGIKDS